MWITREHRISLLVFYTQKQPEVCILPGQVTQRLCNVFAGVGADLREHQPVFLHREMHSKMSQTHCWFSGKLSIVLSFVWSEVKQPNIYLTELYPSWFYKNTLHWSNKNAYISQLLSIFKWHLPLSLHVHFVAQQQNRYPITCSFLRQ